MSQSQSLRVKELPSSLARGSLWDWLSVYPRDQSLISFGSPTSDYSWLALAWDEVDAEEFLSCGLEASRWDGPIPWTTGTFVVLSYDQWDPYAIAPRALLRVFRAQRTLVRDEKNNRIYLCENESAKPCRWQIPEPWLLSPIQWDQEWDRPSWKSSWDDQVYQEHVKSIVDEIRTGRYYQLNLLRYWRSDINLSRAYWLSCLAQAGGPFSACVDVPDLRLFSASPERFLKLTREGRQTVIQTEPIKGTRAVSPDKQQNLTLVSQLAEHPKDRAELSMIVDLMRNDLHKVCIPGSVEVVDPGSVFSYPHVHHLIAKITGLLRSDWTWRDITEALCPGGSITGAPKREVMQAIHEREQRSRAYFMGNILYADAFTGRADSSILIRTAQQLGEDPWEYAAGCGIVVHSQPADELAEVLAKARLILSPRQAVR